MTYCMVVLPSKKIPLSMTDIMVQFLLTIREEIVSRNLHLLWFRLLVVFQCEVVAFGCKDLTTSFHNLISGQGFIKPIKPKSKREILWETVFQLLFLILFRFLTRSVNLQCLYFHYYKQIKLKFKYLWFVFAKRIFPFFFLFSQQHFDNCFIRWLHVTTKHFLVE